MVKPTDFAVDVLEFVLDEGEVLVGDWCCFCFGGHCVYPSLTEAE